jgi:methoxymalonate biosynthesis acyl carrier protein
VSVNNPSQVKETVRNFINSSINIDALGDDENLFESGIVNSLFAVQLMTFVERKFSIEIGMDDLDIENFKSISATAAFVARKAAGQAVTTAPGATEK